MCCSDPFYSNSAHSTIEWGATPQPNLTQIEEIVLKLRKQLGEQMALAVIDNQETKRPAPGPHCPQCQREMHYKDMKDNTVESRVGTLPLERGYYYCQTCHTGLFPLDRQLQLWDKHWSEQIAKQALWLSGLVEFAQAEEILKRVGQVEISDSSVWRRTDAWGERCKAVEATQRATATALPPRSEIVRGETPHATDMGVAMDGAMVHVRAEGWKELKTGCVFEPELRPTVDKASGETMDLAHAVHNSYVAHLGGPELFGQQVWAEAQRRAWPQAHDTIALGDGAPWVWNLVREHFYDSRQAVDWYHATEHLASAAQLLKGEAEPAAQPWFKQQETTLFQGHADQIAQQLHAAAPAHPTVADQLRREAGYFRDNHRRMQYMELREDGFPIGSGMVESGCKQFRKRFNGSGMRWSRPGIERLLPVRASIMSRRFDELWKATYNLPLN